MIIASCFLQTNPGFGRILTRIPGIWVEALTQIPRRKLLFLGIWVYLGSIWVKSLTQIPDMTR